MLLSANGTHGKNARASFELSSQAVPFMLLAQSAAESRAAAQLREANLDKVVERHAREAAEARREAAEVKRMAAERVGEMQVRSNRDPNSSDVRTRALYRRRHTSIPYRPLANACRHCARASWLAQDQMADLQSLLDRERRADAAAAASATEQLDLMEGELRALRGREEALQREVVPLREEVRRCR